MSQNYFAKTKVSSVYFHRKSMKRFVQPSSPGHYRVAHSFLGPTVLNPTWIHDDQECNENLFLFSIYISKFAVWDMVKYRVV